MVSPDWMDDMRKIMGGGGKESIASAVGASCLLSSRYQRGRRPRVHDVLSYLP